VFSAGLDLLDRQLVDPDGKMAGKVDDLELQTREQGPPVVTAILAGPGALARRIGGRPGEWLASVQARLRPEDRDGPARISFGVVAAVGDHVDVMVRREDLDTYVFEGWVRDRIISKMPGS
jgi:sporulation protein YlmC with PRC-barrel domain